MATKPSTRLSTNLHIRGEVVHTGGIAVDHGDWTSGSVTIYADAGHVTLLADNPATLRSLALALRSAADELEELNAQSTLASVPA